MERRRDVRQPHPCRVTLRCPETGRVLPAIEALDVSASGVRVCTRVAHGLAGGELLRVRIETAVSSEWRESTLAMETSGVVVRVPDALRAAIRFEEPLSLEVP